jgi:hypothetical protein
MGQLLNHTRRCEMRRAQSLDCHVVRERDFHLVGGRALDVSPGGMLVAVNEPVELGESVIVSFRETELDIWFDTDAVVSRVLRGRRPGDPHGLAIGLTFGSLDKVERLILRGAIRRYPPPVPRRLQPAGYKLALRKLFGLSAAA